MSPSKFNSPVRTGTFKVQKKTEETPSTSTSYRTLYEVIFVKGSHYSINYLVLRLKTQYGCYSTIVFTLKMESVPKITMHVWQTMYIPDKHYENTDSHNYSN